MTSCVEQQIPICSIGGCCSIISMSSLVARASISYQGISTAVSAGCAKAVSRVPSPACVRIPTGLNSSTRSLELPSQAIGFHQAGRMQASMCSADLDQEVCGSGGTIPRELMRWDSRPKIRRSERSGTLITVPLGRTNSNGVPLAQRLPIPAILVRQCRIRDEDNVLVVHFHAMTHEVR